MSWIFNINIDGSGWTDIADLVDYNSIKRERTFHNSLKPVVPSCSFKLIGGAESVTLSNQLLGAVHEDVPVQIFKDTVAYFTGIIRPSYSIRVTNTVDRVSIECVGKTFILDKTIKTTIAKFGAKVCDPDDTGNSLLHILFFAAGFSGAEINFPSIPVTIDSYVVTSIDKKNYRSEIHTLLSEVGYTLVESPEGIIGLSPLYWETAPPSTRDIASGPAGDMVKEFNPVRKERRYKGVEVKFSSRETLTNVLVFDDTTGGDSINSCNIPLASGEYYPKGATQTVPVYTDYSIQDRTIVAVKNASLVWSKSGSVNNQVFENLYTKANLRFYSGGGTITKLKIRGDAVVEGDIGIEIAGEALAEKIESIELKYVSDQASAQALARGRASYYQNADYEYNFLTDVSLEVGQVVTLKELSVLGTIVLARVVKIKDTGDEELTIVCEGIGSYAAVPVSSSSQQNQPTPVPESVVQIPDMPGYLENYPTYDEVQNGTNQGDWTKTPTVPSAIGLGAVRTIGLSFDRQQSLGSAFRGYDIQVSNDWNGSTGTWWKPATDGVNWKVGLEGDYLSIQSDQFRYKPPFAIVDGNPVDTIYWFRARRVAAESVSDWCAPISATITPVGEDELKAGAVTADKVSALDVFAMTVHVGLAGEGGELAGYAADGAKKTYLDSDELTFSKLTGETWNKLFRIGGNEADLTPSAGYINLDQDIPELGWKGAIRLKGGEHTSEIRCLTTGDIFIEQLATNVPDAYGSESPRGIAFLLSSTKWQPLTFFSRSEMLLETIGPFEIVPWNRDAYAMLNSSSRRIGTATSVAAFRLIDSAVGAFSSVVVGDVVAIGEAMELTDKYGAYSARVMAKISDNELVLSNNVFTTIFPYVIKQVFDLPSQLIELTGGLVDGNGIKRADTNTTNHLIDTDGTVWTGVVQIGYLVWNCNTGKVAEVTAVAAHDLTLSWDCFPDGNEPYLIYNCNIPVPSDSPLYGTGLSVLRDLNISGRYLGARLSAGNVELDTMQQITGTITHLWGEGGSCTGAFINSTGAGTRATSGGQIWRHIGFNSALVTRTAERTQPRTLGQVYIMRIK